VSIGAIVAAFIISNRQTRSILRQAKEEKIASAEALSELSKAAFNLQKHFEKNLNNRAAVHYAGETGLVFDMAMLEGLEKTLNAVQIHQLPTTLVRLGLILSASITQLRMKVKVAIEQHRQMDAAAFEEFFKKLKEMTDSLDLTIVEIEAEAKKLKD
jgi:predicted acylesterase/phospholipase RssA